jgi:hypothetical protein
MFTVDTSGFERMAKSLSKMSGASFGQVVLAETGKILEGCVRRTRVAKAASIRTSVAFRNRNLWTDAQWPPKRRGDPVISTSKNGTVWFIDEPKRPGMAKGKRVGKKVFYDMSGAFRWSNERWARFQDAMTELKSKKTDLATALRSRGLAANSWWQIARAIGIEISVPAYVRNAAPSNGRVYVNGRALQFAEADAFFVEIFNDNPAMARAGGQQILSDSIQARLNHFEIALRKGTFENIKKRAEQFPGVFVS